MDKHTAVMNELRRVFSDHTEIASLSHEVAAKMADAAIAALEPVTVQDAARMIYDEVLQKQCHEAAKLRGAMVRAAMKARIPSACSSARWLMINDAIRALAEKP